MPMVYFNLFNAITKAYNFHIITAATHTMNLNKYSIHNQMYTYQSKYIKTGKEAVYITKLSHQATDEMPIYTTQYMAFHLTV